MATLRILGITAAVSLTLAGGVRAQDAVPLAWDQEAVTAKAQQLRDAVRALSRTARVATWENDQQALSAENYVIFDDLLTLNRRTRALVGQLKNGSTRDQTRALFERVAMNIRRVQANSRQSPMLENSQAEIEKGRAAFQRLQQYYAAPEKADGANGAPAPVSTEK